MMDANDSLSHDPPENWKCYSEEGADGASTSNISSGPGVSRILPKCWEPEAGKTYSVSVSGISAAIAYEVVFVDCD
jgi:hypothetical protein